ncbi:tetraspanin-32 isoform X1 [Erinaceus europaeus]|uniref:Tetraspanin n=1 Tax=Erinaceus europaeus TaxID=9365 RepID=A0ABM3W9N6_ERIEU|nr:tetraspanin-32 isoform X1 [Erinaceus europaeus]
MGPRARVRAAKCQMLMASFFTMLLALSVAALATLTYFGVHFTVISQASPHWAPYAAAQRWAFFLGLSLALLLGLGAVLGATATVREAGGLMAAAFLCFALVFCALAQVAVWRLHGPSQVGEAMLDTYDLLYDRAVRGPSGAGGPELAAIQDTFLCCGKSSPFSRLGGSQDLLCRGPQAERQDCLQGIRSFLKTHGNIISTLTALGLACMVYAILLSSFLWFTIRAGDNLARRGQYTLNPWSRERQPQGPSFFRRCPSPHRTSHLGPAPWPSQHA